MSSSASSPTSRSSTEPGEMSRHMPVERRHEVAPLSPSPGPFSNLPDLNSHDVQASRRRVRDEETMRDFLRGDAYATASTEQSADQRRQSIMAMDRKRRLTGASTHDGARRKTKNGGFHERHPSNHSGHGPLRVDGPSSPYNQIGRRRTNSSNMEGPEVIDLTGSSPQSRPLPHPPRRRSSTSSRRYMVPQWQPDNEVSECPICRRQFSFLFRRHHCRKCGRVVCNECSPHRITIPRQFIVQPPGLAPSRPVSQVQPSETVDLTGDDDEEHGGVTGFISSEVTNSALGGGEKVRLCNPCVPDPQPNPLPSYNPPVLLSPGDIWRRDQGLPPADPSRRASEAVPRPQADWESIRDMRHYRGHGMAFQHESEANEPGRRPRHGRDEGLPPYGIDHSMLPEDLGRQDRPPSYTNRANIAPRLPSYTGTDQGSSSSGFPGRLGPPTSFNVPAHARFLSMDAPSRPSFHGSRPRVSSLFDAHPRSFVDGSSSSRPLPTGQSRLRESDICPICRRALPPRGVDGDERVREAHIIECISSRDTTSSSAPSGRQALMQSPVRAPIQMLPFIATEKDCLGEDGSSQECSICMVEYDVGDQLARLECLCRFHRECIVEWFGRKQECPLHKVA